MVWPLRSTPITGASPLLRASPPTHPASVLNTSQFLLLGALPLTTPAGAAVSGWAFPRSVQPQQTRLASPSCRTPPGQSAGTRQAHPGNNLKPRFRCHVVNHLDTSTAIHSRSPSWSPPDASPAPSPHRSPPRPHDQRSMRRFEASPRRATPKGQTFIGCTAPPSPTITYSSRPPAFVAHQVLTIPRWVDGRRRRSSDRPIPCQSRGKRASQQVCGQGRRRCNRRANSAWWRHRLALTTARRG